MEAEQAAGPRTCHRCGEPGHYAKDCKAPVTKRAFQMHETSDGPDDAWVESEGNDIDIQYALRADNADDQADDAGNGSGALH